MSIRLWPQDFERKDHIYKSRRKYPIIDSFRKDERYSDLIASPFYINLIVKNVADYSSVTDEK